MEVEKMEKHFFAVYQPGFNSEILELPEGFLMEGVAQVSLRSATTRTRGRGGESEDEDCWNVEIYRYLKHVYFNKGWEIFVEKHHLGEDDFVMFKYDGGTCFSVRVFHRSGLEKVYDSNLDTIKEEDEGDTRNTQNVKEVDDDDDNDDDDGGGETSNSSKRSSKNQQQKIRQGTIRMKSSPHHSPPGDSHSTGESRRRIKMKDYVDKIIKEKTKSFSSRNPCVPRLMKYYNVNNGYIMNVPKSFARKMLNVEAEEVTLKLKNRQGRKWGVVLREYSTGHYLILPGGWKRFVVDNSLKVGDVCVFERVPDDCNSVAVLHVHVF